jgi:hypothetical protein
LNSPDKEVAMSPEITSKTSTNILYKALRYCLLPFYNPLRHRLIIRKWRHHADARTLDWDWSKTNFNRIALVNLLLSKFKDPDYLEIGTAGSNSLFDSVPVKRKYGVDPALGGNIRKTSDDFFKDNKIQFDVVFIDGLHTYEQVRQDVINSIKSLKDGGWIALHDMLPRNWIEQHVPIVSQGAWTGDVWKVAFELAQTEGIEFKILKIDCGVGVIKVIRQEVELKNLMGELLPKEFSYYYDNLNKLPIIEWQEAQTWLHS